MVSSSTRPQPPGVRFGPVSRDRAFLLFAERDRDLVRGCALLLVPDLGRAERLASSVLARRYAAWPARSDPLAEALSELTHPRPAFFDPPWSEGTRVRLLDGAAAAPVPVVAELQRLTPEQRASLVLCRYAALSAAEAVGVLRTTLPALERSLAEGTAALGVARPDWLGVARPDWLGVARRDRPGAGHLADVLRSAVADSLPPQEAAAWARSDLEHGRQLVRRQRVRGAAALVAAVLVIVLAAVTVLRVAAAPEAATQPVPPVPASTSTPSETPRRDRVVGQCDVRQPECQATVMRQWRNEMSKVMVSHLDADGKYFTGYSFSYDPRYDTPSFWMGRGGALGLELYRLQGGATEVYLQIATRSSAATRCGTTTKQRCESLRLMDGNRFTLSTSIEISRGIEVQCWAETDQLVTVVARNTMSGKVLDISQADLLKLVQDPRLRLPEV